MKKSLSLIRQTGYAIVWFLLTVVFVSSFLATAPCPTFAQQQQAEYADSGEKLYQLARIFERNKRKDLALIYYLRILDEFGDSQVALQAKRAFTRIAIRVLDPSIARRLMFVGKFFEQNKKWHDAVFAYWRVLRDYPNSEYAVEAKDRIEAIQSRHLRFDILALGITDLPRFISSGVGDDKQRYFEFEFLGRTIKRTVGQSIWWFDIIGYDSQAGDVILSPRQDAPLSLALHYPNLALPQHQGQMTDCSQGIKIDYDVFLDRIELINGHNVYGVVADESEHFVDLDVFLDSGEISTRRFARNEISDIEKARSEFSGTPPKRTSYVQVFRTLPEAVDNFVRFGEYAKAVIVLHDIFETDSALWDSYGRQKLQSLSTEFEKEGLMDIINQAIRVNEDSGKWEDASEYYVKLLNSDASRQVVQNAQDRLDTIRSQPYFRFSLTGPFLRTLPLSFMKHYKAASNGNLSFKIDYKDITYIRSLQEKIGPFILQDFVSDEIRKEVSQTVVKDNQHVSRTRVLEKDISRLILALPHVKKFRLKAGRGIPLEDGQIPFMIYDHKSNRFFAAVFQADMIELADGKRYFGLISFTPKSVIVVSLCKGTFGKSFAFDLSRVVKTKIESATLDAGDWKSVPNKYVWDTFTKIKPFVSKVKHVRTARQEFMRQGVATDERLARKKQMLAKRKLTLFTFVLCLLGLLLAVFGTMFMRKAWNGIKHLATFKFLKKRAAIRKQVKEKVFYRVIEEHKQGDVSFIQSLDPHNLKEKEESLMQKIISSEKKEGELLDISMLGARLRVFEKVELGDLVELLVIDPMTKREVEVFGRSVNFVKERDATFSVGVRFSSHMSDVRALQLRECIRKMETVSVDVKQL